MIKQLLNIIFLMMLTMSALAQKEAPVPSPSTTPAPRSKPPSPSVKQPSNETNDHQTQIDTETDVRTATEKSLQEAQEALIKVETMYSEEVKKNAKLEQTISEIRNTQPIIIKKMELGSFNEECKQYSTYGNDLYTTKTKYLRLKIDYISLLDEQEEMQFDITLYYPDKKITITGKKNEHSYAETKTIKSGSGTVEFSCREGIHSSYTYPAGIYSIEIRYKGVFLGKKIFEIKNT